MYLRPLAECLYLAELLDAFYSRVDFVQTLTGSVFLNTHERGDERDMK